MRVITFQLAHFSSQFVDLCPDCADRDDHDCGSLGPVSHGLHRGYCESANHGSNPAAEAAKP